MTWEVLAEKPGIDQCKTLLLRCKAPSSVPMNSCGSRLSDKAPSKKHWHRCVLAVETVLPERIQRNHKHAILKQIILYCRESRSALDAVLAATASSRSDAYVSSKTRNG